MGFSIRAGGDSTPSPDASKLGDKNVAPKGGKNVAPLSD
jgi:hypothetical protein